MGYTDKIILVFVVVQVTFFLAKPHDPENDERANRPGEDPRFFLGGVHL